MNFLIICTYYPPDSEIAAIRPYMLAKYLSLSGNSVTVLRSGMINGKPDDLFKTPEGVRVISFLGDDCDAARFERGEYRYTGPEAKFAMIPRSVKRVLSPLYHAVTEPLDAWKRIRRAKEYLALEKAAIDRLEGERFDIVFSTSGEFENIFAGEYAARRFGAKWIQDFRDPVVSEYKSSPVWNCYARRIQRRAIESADLCTAVSESISRKWRQAYHKDIVTLYNGYEPDEAASVSVPSAERVLRICYTGLIGHKYRIEALNELALCLGDLIRQKRIDLDGIRFVYAGVSSHSVREVFGRCGIGDIVEDHGPLTRSEAKELQNGCDLFLVLSWNTKRSQGVLTGKFYEGIRAKKPILAVLAGDEPDSELKQLNRKYGYGFCYEKCERDPARLADHIAGAYREKTGTGRLSYSPSEALATAFRYDKITERLLELSEQLAGRHS